MDRKSALGRAARERRLDLGMSQAELAKAARLATRVTVGALENGMPVKDLTLSRIESALGYRPGAFRRFLADGTPLELVDEQAPRESYTDPTERQLMALEELPIEQRRQWVADLRAARARRRAEQRRDPNPGDVEQRSG